MLDKNLFAGEHLPERDDLLQPLKDVVALFEDSGIKHVGALVVVFTMYPRFIAWDKEARAKFLAFAQSAIAMVQSKLNGRVIFSLDMNKLAVNVDEVQREWWDDEEDEPLELPAYLQISLEGPNLLESCCDLVKNLTNGNGSTEVGLAHMKDMLRQWVGLLAEQEAGKEVSVIELH